jgi:hypothetical protein
MYSRPSTSLKAASTRSRTSRIRQHHQCLDDLLRSRCPENRIDALNMAIRFRDVHGADQTIPNELVDEHLEQISDGKFVFWGEKAQKTRNITGARDHVRKSLGNFPFHCSNLGWCVKSSRSIDLQLIVCIFKRTFVSPPSRSQQTHEDLQVSYCTFLTKCKPGDSEPLIVCGRFQRERELNARGAKHGLER